MGEARAKKGSRQRPINNSNNSARDQSFPFDKEKPRKENHSEPMQRKLSVTSKIFCGSYLASRQVATTTQTKNLNQKENNESNNRMKRSFPSMSGILLLSLSLFSSNDNRVGAVEAVTIDPVETTRLPSYEQLSFVRNKSLRRVLHESNHNNGIISKNFLRRLEQTQQWEEEEVERESSSSWGKNEEGDVFWWVWAGICGFAFLFLIVFVGTKCTKRSHRNGPDLHEDKETQENRRMNRTNTDITPPESIIIEIDCDEA